VTFLDDTRPPSDASTPAIGLGVLARCEGCGLVYEVNLLDDTAGVEVADCGECGSPVYVLPSADEALYLAGFGAGWDACAAFVASAATGGHIDELTDVAEAARLAEAM
jgi:hypothetical protein